MMKHLTILALMAASLPAIAAESWPQEIKSSVRQGCVEESTRMGMAEPAAWSYCACLADGLENEFGLQRYGELIAALNEDGDSPTNQTIQRISMKCLSE